MHVLVHSSDSDQFAEHVNEVKRTHPTLDERLRRYRESRKEYDAKREGKKDEPPYREQRGVRRAYRV